MLTAHEAILYVIGNTFGAGSKLATDILCSLENAGYALVRADEVVSRVDYLRKDNGLCNRTKYGRKCRLPVGHDGVHVDSERE